MCPKLFILKEFYFLILKSNVGLHIINIHPSELLSIKTKKFRINESLKKKKKVLHNNFIKKIDNLHFIPNYYILTKFFKEITKYKNDYQ